MRAPVPGVRAWARPQVQAAEQETAAEKRLSCSQMSNGGWWHRSHPQPGTATEHGAGQMSRQSLEQQDELHAPSGLSPVGSAVHTVQVTQPGHAFLPRAELCPPPS